MQVNWKGGFPALVTPLSAADELDLKMFEHNLLAQIHAGVHGVIIGGSLGEASTITVAEKEKLVKAALKICAGRIPVILNIAEGSTNEAMKQAHRAKSW